MFVQGDLKGVAQQGCKGGRPLPEREVPSPASLPPKAAKNATFT